MVRPIFLVLLAAVTVHAASDTAYTTCLADPACRRLYHQLPPNRAVFDAVYALGTDAPDGSVAAASVALRARAAGLVLCPRNERYTVDVATNVGTCTCPDDGTTLCGPVTPFHNTLVYAACFLGTVALWGHVFHAVAHTT